MSATQSTSKIQQKDLEQRFPSIEQISTQLQSNQSVKQQLEHLRSTLQQAASEIVSTIPSGREATMAVTSLEEAMFWVNAAVYTQVQSGQGGSR